MERGILAGFTTSHIDLSMLRGNIENILWWFRVGSQMLYQTSAAFLLGNHVDHLYVDIRGKCECPCLHPVPTLLPLLLFHVDEIVSFRKYTKQTASRPSHLSLEFTTKLSNFFESFRRYSRLYHRHQHPSMLGRYFHLISRPNFSTSTQFRAESLLRAPLFLSKSIQWNS